MKHIFVGLSLLLSAPAAAQYLPPTSRVVTALDSVALNAASTSLTFTSHDDGGVGDTNGYLEVMFWVDYTHANNGALTLTCTAGPSSSDKDYEPTTCQVASGTCTLAFGGLLVTPSLSGDKKYAAGPLRIANHRAFSCIISHGGTPDAGDIVTVKYQLIGG